MELGWIVGVKCSMLQATFATAMTSSGQDVATPTLPPACAMSATSVTSSQGAAKSTSTAFRVAWILEK